MTRENASLRMKNQVKDFNYPLIETPKGFFDRLVIYRPIFRSSKLSWIFHILMITGLVTSAGMDILFAITGFDHATLEAGGIAYSIRFLHRWVLLLWGPVFVIYLLHLFTNNTLREGLERIDYAEYVLLFLFTFYGISYSWDLNIWGTYVSDFGFPENISDYTFHIIIPESPIHALLVYVWVIFSLLAGGLLRKAIANIYLQLSRMGIFPTPNKVHRLPKTEKMTLNAPFYSDNFGITRFANLAACGKCGNCNDVCPVYKNREDVVVPTRKRLQNLRKVVISQKGILARIFGPRQPVPEIINELKQGVFMECTVCGRCATVCPSGIDLPDLWLEARASFQKSELAPPQTKTPEKAILEDKNVFAMDNEDRGMFFDFPEEDEVEIAYFMGCLASFTGTLEYTGQAVGEILNLLTDKWTILREEEWCCGLPLELLGNTKKIHDLAKHNVEKFEELNVKKVVFTCPGCYKTFNRLYPELLGDPLPFETQHITELVKEALDQGLLKQKGEFKVDKLTYYDPCDLARYMGVYEEPRALLRQLTNGFEELEENRNFTKCCGAGGGLRLTNNEMSLNMSPEVLKMAKDIGATNLVTACPACDQILKETAKHDTENKKIEVTDIVAILANHLEKGDAPSTMK